MLEISKGQVLAELQNRVGRENGIHVRDLVARITGQLITSEALERRVRELVKDLRLEHHRICAYPATGYFLAADDRELNETCRFLLDRSVSSVEQVAAMKRRSAPDLYQLFGIKPPPERQQ